VKTAVAWWMEMRELAPNHERLGGGARRRWQVKGAGAGH
jgi:hypothetical protein